MTRNRIIAILVAFIVGTILTIFLVGCSPISAGYITGKSHADAYWYSTTQCHTVGKVTSCTPVMHYMPEQWRLEIDDRENTGWVNVDSETWHAANVGDWYGERK